MDFVDGFRGDAEFLEGSGFIGATLSIGTRLFRGGVGGWGLVASSTTKKASTTKKCSYLRQKVDWVGWFAFGKEEQALVCVDSGEERWVGTRGLVHYGESWTLLRVLRTAALGFGCRREDRFFGQAAGHDVGDGARHFDAFEDDL